MKVISYRLLVLVVCSLLLLGSAGGRANSVEGGSDEARGFSRSEWLARNKYRLYFSRELLFDGEPLITPPPAAVGRAAIAAELAAEPLRVNRDLLATDTVAQAAAQAEPYLAVNPDNPDNLLAGWQENRFADGGARAVNYAASFDGGQTWTEGILPKTTTVNGGRWQRATDPWVAFGPGNRAYYASLLFNNSTPDNAIAVSVSTDGGSTWGAPVEVVRSNNTDFNDKEAVTVDTYPGSPHFGNVYVAWDRNIANNGNFAKQRLLVARSTDGGNTYKSPVSVRKSGANIGAIPRVGPDGTVYLVWAGGDINSATLSLMFSKSTDGGQSWSDRQKLGKLRARGVGNLRVGGVLPSFAVDPNNGALYVAWQDSRFTGVDQAALMVSRDGGSTWSTPARVSDGPDNAAAFTISVATSATGQVAVSYYSLQNDPSRNFLVDQYVRISEDGGTTFQPSIRVSPTSFDARFAAQTTGGFFLGDYAGLAGGESGFHLLWVGTPLRSPVTGRQQPDVFTASAP